MAVAAASRVSEPEPQPLLERRISFHPARDPSSASGIASLPPGIEPLNRGFDAAAAAAAAEPSANAAAAADPPPDGKGTKRSWQEANGGGGEELVFSPIKIGAGLVNLGNTCFLNSVLQCLTYTQPLANYLKTGQHKAACRHSGFCALCALESHVKSALQSWGKPVPPNYIVKNLRSISRTFQPWRQEDAHEYLRCLMESLQKSCLPTKTPMNSPEQEKSLMYKIFGGRLKSQVKCTVCLQRSETVDPFWDLSLDITRADSLAKALAWFTANEILDGENKYHCAKCKKKVRAIKRFTIETAPNILTVQFKRFSSTGMYGQKIDKKVHFGRRLDITPFMSNARDGAVYDLYGVLVHAGGSTHSGHYYCFVRTAGDMWHNLDDSRVRQLSEQNVLDQKAYILFYMRKPMTKPRQPSQPSVAAAGPVASPSANVVKTPAAAVPAEEKALSKDAEVPTVEPRSATKPEAPAAAAAPPPAATAAAAPPAATAAAVAPEKCSPVPAETIAVASLESGATSTATDASAPTDTSCSLPETITLAPAATPVVPLPGTGSVVLPPVTDTSSLPARQEQPPAAPVIETPPTKAAASKPCSPAETATPGPMETDSMEPLDSSCSGASGHRSRKSKTESPRKLDRGYLKLLRAMPKSRRFFMAKALELEHGEVGLCRRRRLMDSESKQRPVSPDGMSRRATPGPVKQASELPNGATSELFGSGVARWEGVDAKDIDRLLKAEHKTSAKKLDEWDEEYDRGKVKKVRRVAVGGRLTPCKDSDASQNTNPFQVLAANRHKKV